MNDRILVVMDSYYPDSRATTYIMTCLLEELSKHFRIDVFCLGLLKNHISDVRPSEHNGVFIEYAKPLEREMSAKYYLLRLKAKFAKIKYKLRYRTTYQYEKLCLYAEQIKEFAKEQNIKTILSVASPTDVHICTEMAVASLGNVSWFPISFDPHAYDSRYSESMRKNFRHEEMVLYKRAKQIFFLKQSKRDYENSVLKDKITFFDLPLLFAEDQKTSAAPSQTAHSGPVKLVYAGSIYKNIRNPEYMLETLSRVKGMDFNLSIIGALHGWEQEADAFRETWTAKFGNRLEFLDRLSREEVATYLKQADVFLNIGNTTYNQCPSKVLDYIASGKPIIHFQKIEHCASMLYLEKYPNVCVVDEHDPPEKSAEQIKTFLAALTGKTVAVGDLKKIYRECDVEYIADLFLKQIFGKESE